MMMNTKRIILDEEKVKDFVGDFNKFFEVLAKSYKKDAKKIKKNVENVFGKSILRYSTILQKMKLKWVLKLTPKRKTKPSIDREEKLRKVEERLLSNKTYARFTTYDGVMTDDDLSLPQKVIHLQRAIDDVTRRKIYYASLQGQLLEKCFCNQRKFIKKLWRKRRLQCSGRYFYERYINSCSNTVNFDFALFPYVFFALTSR